MDVPDPSNSAGAGATDPTPREAETLAALAAEPDQAGSPFRLAIVTGRDRAPPVPRPGRALSERLRPLAGPRA